MNITKNLYQVGAIVLFVGCALFGTSTLSLYAQEDPRVAVPDPAEFSVGRASTTVRTFISLEGGATSWRVDGGVLPFGLEIVVDGEGNSLSGGEGPIVIKIAINVNTVRTVTTHRIPLVAVGGTERRYITINQSGFLTDRNITVVPDTFRAFPGGDTLRVNITLGNGTTGWKINIEDFVDVLGPDGMSIRPATPGALEGGEGMYSFVVGPNRGARRINQSFFVNRGGGSTRARWGEVFIVQEPIPSTPAVFAAPRDLPDLPAEGAMPSLRIVLEGEATGWEAMAPAWVGIPSMGTPVGGRMEDLVLNLEDNPSYESRSATIELRPRGSTSPVESVTIFQLGTASLGRSVVVRPARSGSDPSDVPGNKNILFMKAILRGGATGFSVMSQPDWVTTVTDLSITGEFVIRMGTNHSTSPRTGRVIFVPTGGSGSPTSDTLDIIQRGDIAIGPNVVVMPTRLDNVVAVGATLTVQVALNRGATQWASSDVPDWVTVAGMGAAGEISLMVGENNGGVRTGVLTFQPTGGEGRRSPATVVITQQEFPPQTIDLDPSVLNDVSEEGATQTINLSFGGGATGFTATEADDWVSVPTMATEGRLMVTIMANSSRRSRKDTVVFTPTGGRGLAEDDTLWITQLGTPPPSKSSITLLPTLFDDVPWRGAMHTVGIRFGGGATGFTTAEASEWIRVPMMATEGRLMVTIEENMTFSAREGMVIFEPTGGEGETLSDTLFVNQEAPPQTITLTTLELNNVSWEGETRMLNVALGGGATGFTATAADDWVRVPSTGMAGALTITLAENMTTSVRRSAVTFRPTGGGGEAISSTLSISQQAIPQRVRLIPSSLLNQPHGGITRMVEVRPRNGATGFTMSGADDWVLAIRSRLQLRLILSQNNTNFVREDTLIFTPTGGVGEALQDTLFISQKAVPQTVALSPSAWMGVSHEGATQAVDVTLNGGATGFTTAGADDWVSVPSSGMAGALMITVAENTTTSVRTSTLTFRPTGGTGEGEVMDATFTITQQSVGQTLTLSPSSLDNVSSLGATETLRVTQSGGATGFRFFGADDWVRVPTMLTGGELEITIAPNPDASVRRDTVIFFPTGGIGIAKSDTLTISQLERLPFGTPGSVFSKVRVVNPATKELIIYGLSASAHLILRDLSGQQVFAATLPAGKQRLPLPLLPRGVYLLVLRSEEGEESQAYRIRLLRK